MIVISNPIAVPNEIKLIHSLFDEGLELFHVRKPNFSEEEMIGFVTAIELEFRNRLVLHSYHHLDKELGMNRIHFTEKDRAKANSIRVSNPDRVISTATHTIEDFNLLDNYFDYAFLSPVFKSISKENYSPKTDLLNAIKERTNFNTKLVALGGIEAQNIKKTMDAGFDDVALLGTIWNSNQPIKNFELCQQIVLSY